MKSSSRRKILLAMICCMFTIVMCRCTNERLGSVQFPNGWTCTSYMDYDDLVGDTGFECSGVCPNGTAVGNVEVQDPSQIETHVFPQLCIVSVLTPSPTGSAETVTATSMAAESPDPLASPTTTTTPVPVLPLLTTEMTSCGNYRTASQPAWWVNLRLAEPRVDITGRNLMVTIGGLPSPCGINQGNTSILSCFASRDATYPAEVIAELDGVIVNTFTIYPNFSICDPQSTATSEPGGGAEDSPTSTPDLATPDLATP